jgi:nitrate reductase (cytochrome), electron transfer subunit
MSSTTASPKRPVGRTLNVALLFVIAAAVVGFFTGTWHGEGEIDDQELPLEAVTDSGGPFRPPEYSGLPSLGRASPKGSNRLADLQVGLQNENTAHPQPSPSGLLEQRRRRRAYPAAPPVIPHQVSQRAQPNCRTCHEQGVVLGGKRAPVPGHPMMANCTQCHAQAPVPSGLASLPSVPPPVHNAFLSVGEVQSGPRAWAGAPPGIPHPIFMRQGCLACHGPDGLAGIRTSHPQRGQCVQCHVAPDHRDVPPAF